MREGEKPLVNNCCQLERKKVTELSAEVDRLNMERKKDSDALLDDVKRLTRERDNWDKNCEDACRQLDASDDANELLRASLAKMVSAANDCVTTIDREHLIGYAQKGAKKAHEALRAALEQVKE